MFPFLNGSFQLLNLLPSVLIRSGTAIYPYHVAPSFFRFQRHICINRWVRPIA